MFANKLIAYGHPVQTADLSGRNCIFKMFNFLRSLVCSPVTTNLVAYRGILPVRFATNLPTTTKEECALESLPLEENDKLYSSLEIELRGVDPAVLKSFSWFANTAANHLGIEVGNCWSPRKAHHERMTLLKSVHIYKKHRVQYEIRTYFRYMNFHKLTGSTLDTFLEYIERNLPEGVALNAKKTEIQEMPRHLKKQPEVE